jgi:hypothetical protein
VDYAPGGQRSWCSLATSEHFLLVYNSPVSRFPCKRGEWRMMMFAAHLWPAEDQEVSSAGRKYVVTIYSDTDCKLYDVVHEGE